MAHKRRARSHTKNGNSHHKVKNNHVIDFPDLPRRPSKRYTCLCLRCNGKLVSFLTKKAHQIIMDRIKNHHISTQSEIHTQSPAISDLPSTTEYDAASGSLSDTSDFVDQESYKRKKHFQSGYQPPDILGTKILSNGFDSDISTISEYGESQYVDNVEMFAAPTPASNNVMELQPITKTFAWIILWILKFQQRYHISDIAIDVLIKFIHLLLLNGDSTLYKDFPTSLYTAKSQLHIPKSKLEYTVWLARNVIN